MSLVKTDVVVLGAGIVGISAALHLQARGRDVVVVDRLGVAAASLGMIPSSAMASAACASISNQMRKRVSGDQIAAMSGRE